jgi:hypothetical protein
MPKIIVSGQEFHLNIRHSRPRKNQTKRRTVITLTTPNGNKIEAFTRPRFGDKFSKLAGRKHAGDNLLRKLKHAGFTEQQRLEVFRQICPEFFPKQEENA